jgi:hypothetical protein
LLNENDLLTWVSTVGFPIVAYLLMFFKLDKSIQDLKTVVQELCTKIGEI